MHNTVLTLRKSSSDDKTRLYDVWRRAVDASHDFLSEADKASIDVQVQSYVAQESFWLAVDSRDFVLGFMGLTNAHIDALFVEPTYWRGGVGRALVGQALQINQEVSVDVNEQNLGAVAAYSRLGFNIVGRSPVDSTGRPYPLLHMIRRKSPG